MENPITNKYSCCEDWDVEEAKSMLEPSPCPVCHKDTPPHQTEEYTSDGIKSHYY